MSNDFAEYKLLIMKEQETMSISIKELSGLFHEHVKEYNLFKGKIYGVAITVPIIISMATNFVLDKMK